MHGYIPRTLENQIQRALSRAPATAILGPRQCGKSTTAQMVLKNIDSVYLDLQDRTDRVKLSEPELFLSAIGTECKLSKAPKPSRGFYELLTSLQPEKAWVVAPVDEPYPIKPNVFVCSPERIVLNDD